MADSRILHRKASASNRVNSLTNIEYRVWTQCLLSADDFGIFPATAAVLQADCLFLRRTKFKIVQTALDQIIAVGLVSVFLHQGERYVWHPDWQTWQGLRHPRHSVHPIPSMEVITELADNKTREFFIAHFSESVDPISAKTKNDYNEKLRLARAGGRENTHTNTNTMDLEDPEKKGSLRENTEPAEPVWTHTRGGHASALVGNHRGCFDSPSACARGVCVPAWLGQQWRQQCADDPQAEASVRAFIDGEVARLPLGPVGDDLKVFWKAAWATRHGLQAARLPQGATKGAQTVSAVQRVIEKRQRAREDSQ